MKKFIAFLLSAFLCVGACSIFAGCGPNEDYGNTVVIEYRTETEGRNGIGTAHAYDLAEQFMEYAKDIQYGDKKGVTVVVSCGDVNITAQGHSGYNVMEADVAGGNIANLVRSQHVVCVDDVVKEPFDDRNGDLVSIEDKMNPATRGAYMGDEELDGTRKYYAVPAYAYSPGLTVDENAFNRWGYWLAQEGADNAEQFDSKLIPNGEFWFCNATNGTTAPLNKSAGPDQEFGTQDDGMPATVFELVALCERIKDDDRYPFTVCKSINMHSFLIQGLTTALLGAKQARTMFDYDGGELEIVTGFTDEQLFPGLDEDLAKIRKPIVETINLTQSNGYYASWNLAKYYAESFMSLAYQLDWFTPSSFVSTYSNRAVMYDFFMQGYEPQISEIGLMLVEMTFWVNESKIDNIPAKYDSWYNDDGREERRMTWLSMPTALNDEDPDITSKTRQTVQECGTKAFVIAANTLEDPNLVAACKDLIQFYCSDYQMDRWTREVGLNKSIPNQLTKETTDSLPWYFAKLNELYATNMDVIYDYAEHDIYKSNYASMFAGGYFDYRLSPTINGKYTQYVCTYLSQSTADVRSCFFGSFITFDQWSGYFSGEPTQSLDSNDNPIEFDEGTLTI